MHKPRWIALAGAALLLTGCGGDSSSSDNKVTEVAYHPAAAGFGMPADPFELNAAVERGDQRAIREHAWELWASITAPSGERFQDAELPIWETWYSADELYGDPAVACIDDGLNTLPRDFESPAQHADARRAQGGDDRPAPEVVASFDRFNQEVVDHVCERQYNVAQTLTDLNDAFTPSTPIAARTILDFPPPAIALKPVFWVIKASGVSAMPYWDGVSSTTTSNQANPTPDTWRQCVAIAPPGTPAPSSPYVTACNDVADYPAPVVSLDDFYHFRLSAEEAKDFSTFFFGATPSEGDYALLVAMHVTSKELPRWTWQTFWWSPTPDRAPGGDYRTARVEGVWRNYEMCAAYSMVDPPGSESGTPIVCFNPYLETGLVGLDGTHSNCMTCHQMAAWPNFSTDYVANGFVSPSDPAFAESLKLDFLWSITRAH